MGKLFDFQVFSVFLLIVKRRKCQNSQLDTELLEKKVSLMSKFQA